MNRKETNRLLSTVLVMLFFTILIDKTVTLPSSIRYNISNVSKKILSKSGDPLCNATCGFSVNGTCKVKENFCYIERECHETGAIYANSTTTCLQCQPELNQLYWSLQQQCIAGVRCGDNMWRARHLCNESIWPDFYATPDDALIKYYNFDECSRDRRQCQVGFLFSEGSSEPLACCPGHFCPEGQICMIPCRAGSYCPSPLLPVNGICEPPVKKCPEHQTRNYEFYGCGGSSTESYCPAQSHCPTPAQKVSCSNATSYCPIGVKEPVSCPSGFRCIDGIARRTRAVTTVFIVVAVALLVFVVCVLFHQWLTLKRKLLEQHELVDPPGISAYFRKPATPGRSKKEFQLHIHLSTAKLRNVTRFDLERNRGFTGRIVAGKITALMGGSGCGKSSLLETIHGRRRLQSDGFITFAEHEPLSNLLTDYIGYVPQADIMHNDLTVFETVYYSARARRLNDSKKVIINDVCFVLERLGLHMMHNNMTKTLSGGQRKRVNVAMEIAACPKVLLLDEPTSGLDTASCDDLFDLLQLIKYSAAGPVTIITVIHQPSQELFEKIDYVFFLTPLCCLAYQGPRQEAKQYLKKNIFGKKRHECPTPRHNECDTCFIMLTKAKEHIDNHTIADEQTRQPLEIYSAKKRVFLPFLYVLLRSMRQIYLRGALAEAVYLGAYFLLGTCLGYLFEAKQQQLSCDMTTLPTVYFLVTLAFGILTCISSQRLFGVETTDQTFERESRNYYHPFQYWLAKSLVDIFRLILYPLLFLSMLYIQIVPRGAFSYYLGVMILLSFVCSGIGQLTSVIFDRTEYAYLGGTIVALLSCLLSGFSPTKRDLGGIGFITFISFSRHVQNLLFRYETGFYIEDVNEIEHIWSTQIIGIREMYSFKDNELPLFWLILIGFILRALTLLFLYGKSEYRSERRFRVTHAIPLLKGYLSSQQWCDRSSKQKPSRRKYQKEEDEDEEEL